MKKDILNTYLGKNVKVTLIKECGSDIIIGELFKTDEYIQYKKGYYGIKGSNIQFRSSHIKNIEII